MNSEKELLKPRILVVDDGPDARKNWARILKFHWDVDVDDASYGPTALKKLEDQKYSLIITDYMMPGMDGYELAKAIRNLGIETPIIMATLGMNPKLMLEVHSVGIKDFLSKPPIGKEIGEILERYIPNLKTIVEPDPINHLSNAEPMVKSIPKSIKRALIVYGIDNQETLQNIRDVYSNSGLSKLVIGHFIPICSSNSTYGIKNMISYIPNEIVDKLSAPEDEQPLDEYLNPASTKLLTARVLFEKLNKAIIDFQPDIIIFYSGIVFQTLLDRFTASIKRIRGMYPDVKIAVEPSFRQEYIYQNGTQVENNLFDSGRETVEIVNKVFGWV